MRARAAFTVPMSDQSPFFNEMHLPDGSARAAYEAYDAWFQAADENRLRSKAEFAETVFRRTGITFAVYGEEEAAERLIPFDIVPRILAAQEWAILEAGVVQRVKALNAFLHDIYHDRDIIRAGIVPEALIAKNEAFCAPMLGFTPPGGVYTHIVGTDVVRTGAGEFFVLEDNARTPSGVSYMLENRETMMQLFPELFEQIPVREVSHYPQALRRSLAALPPEKYDGKEKPVVAVMTPGAFNSAYFEHSFLADQMGVELVEAGDLKVVDGRVVMRTTRGSKPIDVLYRRIDDDYLDPLTFRSDSMLGVPGIMDVYRSGGITLANAPGTGISDDKAIYSYMPEIVRFYTGEEPLLPNVPTHRCSEEEALAYTLDNLSDLVVKEVHGSGGYGMLVGPAASKAELESFEAKLRAKPHGYISQPTLALSTCPILTEAGLGPPPSRSAALRALRQGCDACARWVDAGGYEGRVARGELIAGRRHEGHLGARRHAVPVSEPVARGCQSMMLGKTANGLTWMSRYIERAENLARLIEAGQRMSLTRQGRASEEWAAILSATGSLTAFQKVHGKEYSAANATDFLLRADSNPGSLKAVVDVARTNARIVRTAITREVWEGINEFYLAMKTGLQKPVDPTDLPDLLASIHRAGGIVRGAMAGTMLRNDIYNFASLGTYMERADGTARLLDVKYHVLLPRASDVGDELDLAQWEQILRSAHINRAFLMVHGTDYTAANVADFLILDSRMPRSIAHCTSRAAKHISHLQREHGGERIVASDRMDALNERLKGGTIETILTDGLHEFLLAVMDDVVAVSDSVAEAYRFHA